MIFSSKISDEEFFKYLRILDTLINKKDLNRALKVYKYLLRHDLTIIQAVYLSIEETKLEALMELYKDALG